jgi:mRNA interferase RelE/StbE
LNIRNVLNSLGEEPRPVGCKKLIGSKNRWRIRIGNYRILYEINDDLKTVEIFRIAHRKDVYR